MTFKLQIRAPRAGAVHPCPGCICAQGQVVPRAKCAKMVPARSYSPAHRCEKNANAGSLFCSFYK